MSGRDKVVIKSFRHGFEVILDQRADLEDIKEELARKFGENRAFFGEARRAVSFTGRRLLEEEEDELLEVIAENSDITVSCIIESDEERDEIYLRAMKEFARARDAAMSQVYIGTLRSGEVIESDYSITVLGDVNPGARVAARGAVVVLGTLYGEAEAGALLSDPDELEVVSDVEDFSPEHSFVAALAMKPEAIYVNGIRASLDPRELKVPLLSRSSAKIAFERNGEVYIEALDSEFNTRM